MSTGSAQQTSTTTAGVSPFAQNYVDTMLSAGQQQVFNTQYDPATKQTNVTGIKPYVPFGAPMNAQGQVAPYGGQQTGMGWGAYPGSGYGQQQQQQPPSNIPNPLELFQQLQNRAQQPSTYTPPNRSRSKSGPSASAFDPASEKPAGHSNCTPA